MYSMRLWDGIVHVGLWDLRDSLTHDMLGCDGLLRPVDNPGKDAKSLRVMLPYCTGQIQAIDLGL